MHVSVSDSSCESASRREGRIHPLHLFSFAASIIFLWFLSRYEHSYPYNVVVLSIWVAAFALTLVSSGIVTICPNVNYLVEKKGADQDKNGSNRVDPHNIELGLCESDRQIWTSATNVHEGTESRQYSYPRLKIRDLICSALLTFSLGSTLVSLGLQFGPDLMSYEATFSLWRSNFLICWIYAGIAGANPNTEMHHGYENSCLCRALCFGIDRLPE